MPGPSPDTSPFLCFLLSRSPLMCVYTFCPHFLTYFSLYPLQTGLLLTTHWNHSCQGHRIFHDTKSLLHLHPCFLILLSLGIVRIPPSKHCLHLAWGTTHSPGFLPISLAALSQSPCLKLSALKDWSIPGLSTQTSSLSQPHLSSCIVLHVSGMLTEIYLLPKPFTVLQIAYTGWYWYLEV